MGHKRVTVQEFASNISKSVKDLKTQRAEIRVALLKVAPRAVQILSELAEEGNVEAAKFIVEQSVGKARQQVEVTGSQVSELSGFASSVLLARLRELEELQRNTIDITREGLHEGEKEN